MESKSVYKVSKTRYRVWHIPQLPEPRFIVEVGSIEEAKLVIKTLVEYDLFQWRCDIKPDYSNVSGLEYWDRSKGCWMEYQNSEGNTISDLMNKES